MLIVVSRALSIPSSESLSLSQGLFTCSCSCCRSFLEDSGKLASSFKLGGSSLSIGTFPTLNSNSNSR